MIRRTAIALLALPWLAVSTPAGAQVAPTMPRPEAGAPNASVTSLDADGRIVVQATRIPEGINVDGNLDEAVYQSVPAITGLIQQIPDEGQPASEPTEAWIFFDEDNVYVAARMYESVPESEWVANEMRRDAIQLRQNDSFTVMFDTFLDRRNGLAFFVTPIGGFSDYTITNESTVNFDWNVVWDSRAGRFDGGWTVEMRVPFASLRYRPGTDQTWGVQFRRVIRRRNEASYLTAVPIGAAQGSSLVAGIWRISAAATLEGIQVPGASLNLQAKPYAIGGLRTDRQATPAIRNETDADFGFDLKYGLTSNLTADFTYNTDFAQVEVDEQQVNLTRFNLLFPERREFFLEGRGNFDFVGGTGAPNMFFSRRIGLQQGEVVPILVGARLTGKVGAFDVGALNIQTDASDLEGIESANFSALRIKRDILSRSRVGMMLTNRSQSLVGDGSNQLYGADASFAFLDDFTFEGYLAKTESPGLSGEDLSYTAQFDYAGDRYGLTSGYLVVEDNFNPEVGFLQRDNFERYTGSARFSPRPTSIPRVERVILSATTDYLWTADDNDLETRQHQLDFAVQFESSDQISFYVSDEFETLTRDFTIGPDVVLLPGEYDFTSYGASYRFGQQRPVSGTLSLRAGDFWSGTNTSLGFSQGRIEVTPQLSIEPSYSMNWVDLPEGEFETQIGRVRFTYTFSPWMYVSGLTQYNTSDDVFGTNIRFRWEWAAGSELFIVYTEERDTDPLFVDRSTELRNRGLVIKINRLFQF